tara:strand:- start:8086 stop:8739 length:654 start_codon:yes stop_codon:yes gene_type:complete
MHIDYPKELLEIVILDDGDIPFIGAELRDLVSQKLGIPIKYIYNKERHMTIGEKRNKLVKYASHNTLAFMDDDDLYNPAYIRHSVETLKNNKVGLVGSNAMIFCFIEDDFILRGMKCEGLNQIHEATMVFTKKFFKSMGGFGLTSKGEGGTFLKDTSNVALSDINKLMICCCWENNTIDKSIFKDDQFKVASDKLLDGAHKDLLKEIMILKKSEDIV